MSLPKTITRPNTPLYSTQALELFVEDTYESWKAANPGQEPPFDTSFPPQYHCDDRYLGLPADTPVQYIVVDTVNRKMVPYATNAGRASKVNIPNPNGAPATKINIPQPWDTKKAADACAAIVGGTVVDQSGTWASDIFGPINPALRYTITFPGATPHPIYAAQIATELTNDTPSRLQSYFTEIGLKLDILSAEDAAAKAYAADAAKARVPMPMAALLANEVLVPGVMNSTLVQRTDLEPAINNTPGSGLTSEEHGWLQAIYTQVTS